MYILLVLDLGTRKMVPVKSGTQHECFLFALEYLVEGEVYKVVRK